MSNSRFQFSLRDVLVILVIICAGLALLSPVLLRSYSYPQFRWPPAMEYPLSARIGATVTVIVTALIASFIGVFSANRKGHSGAKRALWLGFCCALGWSGLFAPQILDMIIPGFGHRHLAGYEGMAMGECKAFAEAEEIYHRSDWDKDGVIEYAPSLQDLFETKPGAMDILLIPKNFADAEVINGNATPKGGYVFKVLKKGIRADQKDSKVVDYFDDQKNMTKGYALLAVPAVYGFTGCNCFIIDNRGTIYQRDFEMDSMKVFEQINVFDPRGWLPSE